MTLQVLFFLPIVHNLNTYAGQHLELTDANNPGKTAMV
jgi:hypothetical protein